MKSTTPTAKTAKANALPAPTPSEDAFDRAFSALSGPSTSLADARYAQDDGVRAFVDEAFARQKEFLRDPYASIGDASSFHSKIAGVSFEGRQDTIAGLHQGAALRLVREPHNEHDPNAIAVFYGDLQLGYVRAGVAKHLAPLIDAGACYRARVENLTGVVRRGASRLAQDDKDRYRGVNVFIERDATATVEERSQEREMLRSAWHGDAEAVRAALIGASRPHEEQLAVLERIERGRNTLALFGTGRGKSFCFQYPAVLRALANAGKTLAIYPLRALANDQYEALQRRLDQFGLRILRANGSIGAQEREDLFAALSEGAWDLVLATPEFLAFHREAFRERSAPSFVVVDESHHLHESRHRRAYETLGETIVALGSPQVLALTATAGEEAFARIVEQLRIDAWVIDPTVRENLHLVDARNERDKIGYLRRIFERGEKGIVYCNSRSESGKVAEQLRKTAGEEVMFYHAGMPNALRRDVETYFREGALRIVVATSAFGEGIDLPDVRHVVLYHLNFNFTEFNQQAGRAGRDGEPAWVHLLFGESDRRINEYIIDLSAPTLPVLRRLYAGMKGLARDGILRSTFADIARTLELDKADERTVSAALRVFQDEGLIETAEDDDGRYVRFLPIAGKMDLTRNERYTEGEAERESFKRFAEIALTVRIEDLECLVNRPIYPNVALRR
ncbi:MAG TPA: helicase-related protein [Candidatus Tyrphobacter sp.]